MMMHITYFKCECSAVLTPELLVVGQFTVTLSPNLAVKSGSERAIYMGVVLPICL